jgi:hypothetical protein
MSVDTFYSELSALDDFADVADPSRYTPVPDDWLVAVGDVRNSTGAIEEGKYKHVNVVGASLIAATLNVVGPYAIPYTFAGDGAALCVPPDVEEGVRRALAGTRAMARERFGFRCAVGLVPMADLRAKGAPVLVGRFRLSDHIQQAVFMGGGLHVAEEQVKSQPDGPYGIAEDAPAEADFTGLECRWNNVPSRKEEIVALLVQATGETVDAHAQVYEEVIDTIHAVYGDPDSRPLIHTQLQMSTSPQQLSIEHRIRTHGDGLLGWGQYWGKMAWEYLTGIILMGTDWSTSQTNWGTYKEDLENHTDYRKMDGTLRQVIAGTTEQRRRLEAHLRQEHERGRLIYGLEASEEVMITCLVIQNEKEHVHFVDGAGGGYARAAKALKAREASLEES